jgi:hypothetical protein
MSVHLSALQGMWEDCFQSNEFEEEHPIQPFHAEVLKALKEELNHTADGKSWLELGKIIGKEIAQFNPRPDIATLTNAVHFLISSDAPQIGQSIASKTALAIVTHTEPAYTPEEWDLMLHTKTAERVEKWRRTMTEREAHQFNKSAFGEMIPLGMQIPQAQLPKVRAAMIARHTQADLISHIGNELVQLRNWNTVSGQDREHIFTMAQFAWQSKIFTVLTKEQQEKINEARGQLAGNLFQRLGVILQNFFWHIRNLLTGTQSLSEEEHMLVIDWLNAMEDRIWPTGSTFMNALYESDSSAAERIISSLLDDTQVPQILSDAKNEFDAMVHQRGDKASAAFKALSVDIEAIMHEVADKIAQARCKAERSASKPFCERCFCYNEIAK